MSGRREDYRSVVPFIEAVRARPCLWNSSIVAYTKKDQTCAAWKEIAAELNDTERNCRDRWKNIRTAYVRSLKPEKPEPGKNYRRTYYLADHLTFLRPYVKGKSSGNKLEDASVDDSCGNADEDCEAMSEEETPEEPPWKVQVIETTAPKIEKIELKETKEEKNEADSALKEWMNMKKEMLRKDNDADEFFLLSLLPDIRKLSAQRKRTFKLEAMSILNKLLGEDEREAGS